MGWGPEAGETEPRPGRGEKSPWPSFLDLLLESLGAASGGVWRLEGERWTLAAERRREGWPVPARGSRRARGHPFTWSVREDLVLQVPAERVADDGRDGWCVLVPDPRSRRLVELWFPSPPGPPVRESTAAIRAHLAWLGRSGEGRVGAG